MESHVLGLLTLLLAGYSQSQMLDNGYEFNATSAPALSSRQARRSAFSDSCTTNDGSPGTCMTRFSCMRQGGTPKGFCSTYGICCETNLRCGQTSKLKRTIIRNPAPITTTSCQYIIEPYNTNVCQLLIEFQRFELMQPQDAGQMLQCVDRFTIGDFDLCGENSQQHLYIPFNVGAGIDHVALNFELPNRWAQSTWHLVVTQLECPAVKQHSAGLMPFINQNNLHDLRTIFTAHHSDLDILAPPGCDQYFTQPTGLIKSFNYRDSSTFYMPNLKYVICIKSLPGANFIEYTVNGFSMSAEVSNMFYDEACHSTVETPLRAKDFLMIPQSFFANNDQFQPTYYCGEALSPGQIIIASAPFIMHFWSDELKSNDLGGYPETGFSFNYRVKAVI